MPVFDNSEFIGNEKFGNLYIICNIIFPNKLDEIRDPLIRALNKKKVINLTNDYKKVNVTLINNLDDEFNQSESNENVQECKLQ